MLLEQPHGADHVGRVAQRLRRLQQHHDIDVGAVALQPLHRVLDHGQHGRVVAGELGRPEERRLEPVGAADLGDLLGIGRQQSAVEDGGGAHDRGGIGEQRLAA